MLTAAAQGHVTRAPWAWIFPGLALFLAMLGFNLLGDALQDVLESKLLRVSTTARLLSLKGRQDAGEPSTVCPHTLQE
jgi:hypothetical protein